jgi:hypothetical protein
MGSSFGRDVAHLHSQVGVSRGVPQLAVRSVCSVAAFHGAGPAGRETYCPPIPAKPCSASADGWIVLDRSCACCQPRPGQLPAPTTLVPVHQDTIQRRGEPARQRHHHPSICGGWLQKNGRRGRGTVSDRTYDDDTIHSSIMMIRSAPARPCRRHQVDASRSMDGSRRAINPCGRVSVPLDRPHCCNCATAASTGCRVCVINTGVVGVGGWSGCTVAGERAKRQAVVARRAATVGLVVGKISTLIQ